MFDLSGKVALVTGATGGIGGAIAKSLHGRGATVVLSGTRAEALEALRSELADRVHVVAANLADTASVEALPKSAEAAAGPIDILVNNAGITRDNLFMRMKDEEWDQVIAVNLTSAFRLSRALIRGMMKKRWGRIISITSIVGTTGNPGQASYVAAKAGLAGMTKSLAAEVASRNITVNCVAPGLIETAMSAEVPLDEALKMIPMRRAGQPDDVAAVVSFLCSDEASYVTRQVISVNGGML